MGVGAGVRIEKAAATRAALVAAARELFARSGYHATGTPDLVAAAGVTRGALYHHFRNKEDLFEAVFRDVGHELEIAAGREVASLAADPWRQLLEGLQAFLRLIAASPAMQRILLIDGPAVFGWARWRELESEFTYAHMVIMLETLMDSGVVDRQPPAPLAHLIVAALNDAALSIAHSQAPEATRAEVGAALRALTLGLRKIAGA